MDGAGPPGPNDLRNTQNSNSHLSSGPQQSQQPQNLQNNQPQHQFQMSLPPNFDLNALSPADREMLLRRLQLQQQQQQQQQFLRARQAQAQAQNFQRMTMNAYTTPRPPLNQSQPAPVHNPMQTFFVNPLMNMPMPMGAMGYQNYPNINRPTAQNSINPALLQPGGTIKTTAPLSNSPVQQITHINPQQFTNPLKSDPVLYSMNSTNLNTVNNVSNPSSNTTSNTSSNGLNIAPFDEQVMSSEGNFIDHLIKFYDCIKFTNRVVPQIANRPLSLFRLFQAVNAAGGFVAVGEAKKWPLVTQTLQLPANNYEVVATIRATYYTFLYAYEQYFIQKKTLDTIDWPNQSKQQQFQAQTQAPVQAQTQQRTIPSQVPSQSQTPAPIAVPFIPQTLKYIPDTDLHLWKTFADAMKVPIAPISDLDTAILYLNSPYITLKIEALLATQKLFAQSSPKELQSAGFSSESLKTLLESLESLWSTEGLSTKSTPFKTMETFWSEVDSEKRNFLEGHEEPQTNLMICRQITSLIRTLAVAKGPEVCQILAQTRFIRDEVIVFNLMKANDMELFKDALIIYESISPHIFEDSLFNWTIKQCQLELEQVRKERLTLLTAKFVYTLNLDRIGTFDNLSTAKQTVTFLITQCGQLWKSVPAHIFLLLSTTLNILTSHDATMDGDLGDFCAELVEFMEMFILPTVALLRSVRGLLESTMVLLTSPGEELKRILETVIYSPIFSLTDGGFLELSLQILSKCQSLQSDCLSSINWTGIFILMRELRDFWRHSDCQQHVPYLAKTCYTQNSAVSSPSKKPSSMQINSRLTILNGSSQITSIFSHPFPLLSKSLFLLSTNFHFLPDRFKLDLLELAVEWNLETPSQWGREVLGCTRIEESIKIIRDIYFN